MILSQDYGVHIYRYVDDKWEAIENRIDYPPGEKGVYPKDDQPFRGVMLIVHPFILSNQPVTVRVVVVGNSYNEANGETGKKLGAFIDVTLEPKGKMNELKTQPVRLRF